MIVRQVVLGFILFTSMLSAAQDDIASAGVEPIERYRGAWIVRYAQQDDVDYRLPLGGIEQVNGVERPEDSELLTGHLTRITYRLQEGTRTRKIADFYQELLASLDAKIRYECRGRACGSSNYWANEVFDNSRLYGLAAAQHYIAAELPGLSLAIYITERGNRRIYVQVEAIETDSTARLITQLDIQGHVVLATDQLPQTDALQRLLGALDGRDVALVIHHRGDDFGAALAAARKVQSELSGVIPQSVDSYAVGRYIPSVLGDAQFVITLVRE